MAPIAECSWKGNVKAQLQATSMAASTELVVVSSRTLSGHECNRMMMISLIARIMIRTTLNKYVQLLKAQCGDPFALRRIAQPP